MMLCGDLLLRLMVLVIVCIVLLLSVVDSVLSCVVSFGLFLSVFLWIMGVVLYGGKKCLLFLSGMMLKFFMWLLVV